MLDFLFPRVYAQVNQQSFDSLLSKITEQILNPIILLLFSLAVIYFLYGVFVFVQNAESPDKRVEGRDHIIWGVIGMFIMVSVYGIINLVLNTISS